jgi:large-conductance mechanosensitive channel
MNALKKKEVEETPQPADSKTDQLLTEIRDALTQKK